MTTTVLRSVPCRACGHRIGPHDTTCAYCGSTSKRKPAGKGAPRYVVRPVGRCSRCGGRMRRDRSLVARLLAFVRRRRGRRLACSACGHRETAR